MYAEGDIVVYGSQGVCRVANISEKNFGIGNALYYELISVYDDKSMVYVPVGKSALEDKMHKVLSAADVEELIKNMPDEKPQWIENENLRKQSYKEILESGDRKLLIRAIKAFYSYKNERIACGKKLHVCDERFLKEAEKMLYDEFAYVLKIDRHKVLDYIYKNIEGA